MKKIFISIILIFVFTTDLFPKLKGKLGEVSSIVGIRDNYVIGYGLVVGLKGTGDSKNSKLLQESVVNMLQKFDMYIDAKSVATKNMASVVVTANIPSFKRTGDAIEITVSSVGDSKNISGGILLQTPLKAADGITYAAAQGTVITYSKQTRGRKGTSTIGYIPNGAIIERETETKFITGNKITLSLLTDDWSSVSRAIKALNDKIPGVNAGSDNLNNIEITIPPAYRDRIPDFISEINTVEIEYEEISKVVFDNRTKTIVMGGNIKVNSVAVSHGDLKLEIVSTEEEKEEHSVFILEESADVKTIVDGLNRVGATVDDIIAILNALKNAGALKAKLIIL